MILLADSGTTKCDWIFVDSKRHDKHFEINTPGLNPVYHTENEIIGVINNSNDILSIKNHVEEIYFFGSGCGSAKIQRKMKETLSRAFFKAKDIHVAGDIEGAVYACTDQKAVIAILGTGSNSCYFDGSKIEMRVPSLGYSLMDDGAGNAIGRACLRAYYYGHMPEDLRMAFSQRFDTSIDQVKKQLYKEHAPSQYLASFAPFVFENSTRESMKNIVYDQIDKFFMNSLPFYANELRESPIHFVGSVAHYSQEIIKEQCAKASYELGHIIQKPILNLAENLDRIKKYFS